MVRTRSSAKLSRWTTASSSTEPAEWYRNYRRRKWIEWNDQTDGKGKLCIRFEELLMDWCRRNRPGRWLWSTHFRFYPMQWMIDTQHLIGWIEPSWSIHRPEILPWRWMRIPSKYSILIASCQVNHRERFPFADGLFCSKILTEDQATKELSWSIKSRSVVLLLTHMSKFINKFTRIRCSSAGYRCPASILLISNHRNILAGCLNPVLEEAIIVLQYDG